MWSFVHSVSCRKEPGARRRVSRTVEKDAVCVACGVRRSAAPMASTPGKRKWRTSTHLPVPRRTVRVRSRLPESRSGLPTRPRRRGAAPVGVCAAQCAGSPGPPKRNVRLKDIAMAKQQTQKRFNFTTRLPYTHPTPPTPGPAPATVRTPTTLSDIIGAHRRHYRRRRAHKESAARTGRTSSFD